MLRVAFGTISCHTHRLRRSAVKAFFSTFATGKARDLNAVVEIRAGVIGVKGLKIVDISAAPFMPPSHPRATICILAEKIVDDIRNNPG